MIDTPMIPVACEVLPVAEPPRQDMFVVVGRYGGYWSIPSKCDRFYHDRVDAEQAAEQLEKHGWTHLFVVRIPGNQT